MSHYLPQELIDEILKNRSTYVVIQHKPNYEWTTTDILGVFFDFDNAIKLVLKNVFENLNYNHYDPAKRFYQRKSYLFYGSSGELEWDDSWNHRLGIDEFRIEEWKPEIGKQETKWFNFDLWIKSKVINKNMSSSVVKSLLIDWKRAAMKGIIPDELQETFENELKNMEFHKSLEQREQWVERHGSIAPYPFGNNGGIIEQLDDE